MPETKYIADLHLMDPTSLDWRKHLNLSLEEYLVFLKDKWNQFTSPDDIVYIVGDLGYPVKVAQDTIRALNGHKILVLGNHDDSWIPFVHTSGVFEGCHESINQNGIYIRHIPELEDSVKCNYFIHGHHHQYTSYEMLNCLIQYANDVHRYNCAADLIGHKPCTIQELALKKEELLERCRMSD